jgi:hypothetical protein
MNPSSTSSSVSILSGWESVSKACTVDPKTIQPIPKAYSDILEKPCPWWTDKKVKDTHMLIWSPEEIVKPNSLASRITKTIFFGSSFVGSSFDFTDFNIKVFSNILGRLDPSIEYRVNGFDDEKRVIKEMETKVEPGRWHLVST